MSVLALLVLGACSSSNSSKGLDSQAIDGYIVGANVLCDGKVAAQAQTLARGQLTCPAKTVLVTVSGGADVGFDDDDTNDIPFTGELSAPAGLGYVTPLSTVAVQMSSNAEGVYDATMWAAKVSELGNALGESALDLTADPSDIKNPALIRLNAQIHQVLSAFAPSQADYKEAIKAFATVMAATPPGSSVDLADDVSIILTKINAALPSGSKLIKSEVELTASATTVALTNQTIAQAVKENQLGLVAAAAVDASVARSGVTINRSAQSVFLQSNNFGNVVDTSTSINEFEDNTLTNNSYQTQVDKNLVQVGYNNDVLQFDKDMNDVQVTMGFELKSTDAANARGLSFYSDDILLSATKGDSDSLVITVPEGAALHATGTDSLGTETTAEVLVGAQNTFSNAGGQFSVNYSSIVDELERLDFENIFAETAGNYEMTLIIGGIQLKEVSSGGEAVPATRYAISVGDQQRSGAGFKGYISYLD